MTFDVYFDHRLDANGKDPDIHSQTLKSQHVLIWSKPLPDGTIFELTPERGKYLLYSSHLGLHHLSSDSISHSFRNQRKMQSLREAIPASELDEFQAVGSLIGARILFPGNRVNGQATINAARGFNSKINDRFDLTLECIRLHYQGLPSPLDSALNRYASFFRLFVSFEGYVKFFLLNDLTNNDCAEVKFLLPHDSSFETTPRPDSIDSYMRYKENTMNFVQARNRRIQTWAEHNLS